MEGLLKLGVEESILLYSLQPEKGSYELLDSFRKFESIIRFSEEETRNYDIKHIPTEQFDANGQPKMMVAFNKEVAGDYTKECKVPARMLSYLTKNLEDTETKEELTFQFLGLYERFVLGIQPISLKRVVTPSIEKVEVKKPSAPKKKVEVKVNGDTDSKNKSDKQ